MDSEAQRDLQRRVFVSTLRMSPIPAGIGGYVGWLEGRWAGAVSGAILMAFVFMPLAGVIGYVLVRRSAAGGG